MKRIGIYMIKNLKNNKVYIGQSTNIYSRWNKHRYELRKNNHKNSYLQNSWNKYGEDNFEFSILEVHESIDKLFLSERENVWIEVFDSTNEKWGYNLYYANIKGECKHTNRSKQRLSQSMKKHHKKKLLEKYLNGFTLINIKSKPIKFHKFSSLNDLEEFLKKDINKYDKKILSYLNYNKSYRGYILTDIKERRCDYLSDILMTKEFNIPPKNTQFKGHSVIVNGIEFNSKTKAAEYIGISAAHLSRLIKANSQLVYNDFEINLLSIH